MQSSANMSIRAVVRLMATAIGLTLAIALSRGVALAAGITVTGHTTVSTTVLSAPSNTTSTHLVSAPTNVNLAGSATQHTGSGTAGTLVSAPANINVLGTSNQTNRTAGTGVVSAPVNANILGNSNQTIGGNTHGGLVSAPVNVNVLGTSNQANHATAGSSAVSVPANVNVLGNATQTSGAGTSRGITTSAAVANVHLGNGNAPGSVSVTAPTTVHAMTSPTVNTQVTVGNTSLHNTTTVPTNAGAATCPVVGINVSGPRCGSSGSATALVFAPTRAQTVTNPSVSTQAHVAGNTVNNTTSVPVGAHATSCPLVGIGVRGYACGAQGSGTVVAYAPTSAHGTIAPSASTHATVLGNQLNNATTAPTSVYATTCPLVGIGVRGYGCGRSGSATAVAFAPTSGRVGTTPTTSTQGNVAGNTLNNTTTAPSGATLNTCPLVGINVHGYGCGAPGSATGVVFAPTSSRLGTTPTTSTQGSIAGIGLTNATKMPADAALSTCPLIGINVHGYGCGNRGSATAVVFAPTAGSATTTPYSTTHATLGQTDVGNTTSLPTGAGLTTCPLIGLNVRGYGCGTPGSATGVITAPTNGQVTTVPVTTTQLINGNTHLGSTTSVPTSVGITACPLIGINVRGYGCGMTGSPIGATAPPTGNLPGSTGSVGKLPGSTGVVLSISGSGSPSGAPSGSPSASAANGPAQGPASGPQNGNATPLIAAAARTNGATPSVPAAPQATTAQPAVAAAPAASSGAPSSQPSGSAPLRAALPRLPASSGSYSLTLRNGSIAGVLPGRGSVALHAAVPAARAASALAVSSMPASAPGLSVLPRTGGGMGSGGNPSVPLLPGLLALLLMVLGTLTRKVARLK